MPALLAASARARTRSRARALATIEDVSWER
eukprot:CAMPEP_0176232590 /NCGR_PEP_ID=MMETSP0121_2-20121125/25387_1 /TAXON_ID=160619 /ORGANISM="Kryptoperidinium foliaceum, Strain CCMP 1326" /LENGTH=30 /DNA_ID= /DNA_START= /DNA_END= /DNA_ORIENTATION=